MGCTICNKKIETIFLGKILGTYTRNKGKKTVICSECQSKQSKKSRNN